MRKIVLASGNAGKLAEIRQILAGMGMQIVAQGDLGIADAEETASTFVENALIKARHAARLSGLPALGDDSGICVDALGGAPGLLSARYAGGHGESAANIAKLLEALRDVPDAERGAHFHCSIVLLEHADRRRPLVRAHPANAARRSRLWLRPGIFRSGAWRRRGRARCRREEPRQSSRPGVGEVVPTPVSPLCRLREPA